MKNNLNVNFYQIEKGLINYATVVLNRLIQSSESYHIYHMQILCLSKIVIGSVSNKYE